MRSLVIAVAMAFPFAVHAAPPASSAFKDCSTKASKMTPKKDLLATAPIKEAEAKRIALESAGPGAKIVKGGIETEDGCLVYSYHVKAKGAKDQNEVFVDAGTGAILKQEHESAARAAVEKPVDKTKEAAGKTKEKVTGEPSTNQAMKKGG